LSFSCRPQSQPRAAEQPAQPAHLGEVLELEEGVLQRLVDELLDLGRVAVHVAQLGVHGPQGLLEFLLALPHQRVGLHGPRQPARSGNGGASSQPTLSDSLSAAS
jgi:hypothetical protein